MVIDVNQIYGGNHFTIYTNIKLLCCTSETNIMLYASYILILKNIYKIKSSELYSSTEMTKVKLVEFKPNKDYFSTGNSEYCLKKELELFCNHIYSKVTIRLNFLNYLPNSVISLLINVQNTLWTVSKGQRP